MATVALCFPTSAIWHFSYFNPPSVEFTHLQYFLNDTFSFSSPECRPKTGFPTAGKAMMQRKGGSKVNLKSTPPPTLAQMQPLVSTLIPQHTNPTHTSLAHF